MPCFHNFTYLDSLALINFSFSMDLSLHHGGPYLGDMEQVWELQQATLEIHQD
jgi:hypothetical protein